MNRHKSVTGSLFLMTVPYDENPHLQMEELRLREVKELAHGHRAAGGIQQSWTELRFYLFIVLDQSPMST